MNNLKPKKKPKNYLKTFNKKVLQKNLKSFLVYQIVLMTLMQKFNSEMKKNLLKRKIQKPKLFPNHYQQIIDSNEEKLIKLTLPLKKKKVKNQMKNQSMLKKNLLKKRKKRKNSLREWKLGGKEEKNTKLLKIRNLMKLIMILQLSMLLISNSQRQ